MALHPSKNAVHSEKSDTVKRQPMDLEEIFANHILDMGLISKIYEKLKLLNNEKTKSPV